MKRTERWAYSVFFACKNACRTTVRANRMYALSLSYYNKERTREKKNLTKREKKEHRQHCAYRKKRQ